MHIKDFLIHLENKNKRQEDAKPETTENRLEKRQWNL